MKIPKTTENNPYVRFSFDVNGKMKLSICNSYWGGKNSGFISTDGTSGNTCLPEDLESYIKAFKIRNIKKLEKEILELTKKLNKLKNNL